MSSIASNVQEVQGRISAACRAIGRPEGSVRLMAVSKTQPAGAVREAVAAGLRLFGENYVQEACAKQDALADLRDRIEWHLIGPLQANKTRLVAERFDAVHSVDRLRIAERLSAQRPAGAPPLNVCVQVKPGDDPAKGGLPPDEAAALARQVARLPGLALRGLMCMLPEGLAPGQMREQFGRVAALRARLVAEGLALDTLSMGMSGDFAEAIAEGATLVRVGTALFGPRAAPPPAESP